MTGCVAPPLGTLLMTGCVAAPPSGPTRPSVHHAIAYAETANAPSWTVETFVTGINPTMGVRLRLDDWGEWTELPRPYVLDLESEPPVSRDPERVTDYLVHAPADWDGRLWVTYRIAAVPQADGHTLMPYHAETYSLGFQRNTLMRLVAGGGEIESAERLTLLPPEGWIAVTDLGGHAPKGSVQLTDGNTAIVFGRPTDQALEVGNGRPVRCWQFGGDAPVCRRTARVVVQLLDAFGDLPPVAGRAPADTTTILIPEGRRGGTGGAGGITIGYNANLDDDPPAPNTTILLAHELLHSFVPVVKIGETTAVWFHEGFTEYLAHWYSVSAGLVEPTTFARRLQDKARAVALHPASPHLRFADGAVRWRDGRNEELAYDGGAIAAFGLDVASRLRGGGGVQALVQALHADAPGSSEVPYGAVVFWLSATGLDNVRDLFEGIERYDVDAGLRRIGFTEGRREALLVYTGVATDAGLEAGRVLDIDPEGPAARSALRVGDVIEDYAPKGGADVQVPEHILSSVRHQFGLNKFARGNCCELEVRRDASRIVVEVNPWLMPGGWEVGLVAERRAVASFFRSQRTP